MKLFKWCKDGGPESTVSGFFFVEIKSLFSIVLLRFSNGSRDAYHDHAFNCISWVLKGQLSELLLHSSKHIIYTPSLKPVITKRDTFHKVVSSGTTWVISFRGPWSKTWNEYHPSTEEHVTLSNGRVKV